MAIDTTMIPDETKLRIGETVFTGLRNYLKQPGARERLEARTKARNERKENHET